MTDTPPPTGPTSPDYRRARDLAQAVVDRDPAGIERAIESASTADRLPELAVAYAVINPPDLWRGGCAAPTVRRRVSPAELR